MHLISRIALAGAFVGSVAGLASAMPTPLSAYTSIETRYPFNVVLGSLPLISNTAIPAGTSTTLTPADPLYGAPVNISFNVSTVGMTRTVTMTYETAGDPFVAPYAFSQIPTPPPGGFYGITFGINFTDPEWTGGTISRFITLSGDGVSIVAGPSSGGFSMLFHTFLDDSSPAEPGFFNGPPVIADRYTQTVTYSVIPAPAGAGLLMMAVLPWARRRGR